jgi:hypothetical protein
VRKQYLVILIVVIFVACQEQGSKISSYDLESFVRAEGLGAKNNIQNIALNFKIEKGKERAICKAIRKEIDKFDSSVMPELGITRMSVYYPKKHTESDGEYVIRVRAIKLFSSYRSAFRKTERECNAIADNIEEERD